jgi:hypothetical protein
MNADASEVTLRAVDREYTISRHSALGGRNSQSLRGLKVAIGRSNPVFPLRYETDFLGPVDAPIAGTLTAVTDAHNQTLH